MDSSITKFDCVRRDLGQKGGGAPEEPVSVPRRLESLRVGSCSFVFVKSKASQEGREWFAGLSYFAIVASHRATNP